MNWEKSKAITPLKRELPGYMIKPLTITELRDYVMRLKNRMALLALPSSL